MTKRTLVLLVVLVVVVAAAAVLYIVDPFKPAPEPAPSPTVSAEPTILLPTPTATLAAPSATPAEATPTPTPAEIEAPAEPTAPTLLFPPDGTSGSLLELVWSWPKGLGEDEWFEVQIWPDQPDAQPGVFGWQKGTGLNLTSAHLMPGTYRWRVVVVRGRDISRGEELSDYSPEGIFTITRPSTMATISVTPPIVPSRTPSVTPTPTATLRRYWWASPTPTYKPTITRSPTGLPTIIEPTVPKPTVPKPSATPVPTVPSPVPTVPTPVPTVPTPVPTVPTPTLVPTTVPPTSTPAPTIYP